MPHLEDHFIVDSWVYMTSSYQVEGLLRNATGQKKKRLQAFFFQLSCARHYNSGSHWTVLELSLLDNGIKKKD